MTDPAPDGPRVSATQVAELAGVGASAVSNWRKRFPNFPRPVGAAPGGGDLFALAEVEAWLRQRKRPPRQERDTASQLWHAFARIRGHSLPGDPGVIVACAAALLQLGRELHLPLAADPGTPADRVAEHIRSALDSIAQTRPDVARALEPVAELDAIDARLLMDTLADSPRDALAAAVDDLLSRASRYSEFRTDPDHATLLAALAQPRGRIFDPAAGSGELLLAAARHASATGSELYGQEMNADAWRLAIARSILHDVPVHMALGDSFLDDAFQELRADVILCEPPYGGKTAPARELQGDPRWQLLGSFDAPPARADEFAWLAHVIFHLAPEGRAYVLMPSGALFRGGIEGRLRSELVRRGTVEAIITLPTSPAEKRSVARAVWVVRPPTHAPLDVLFVAAEQASATEAFDLARQALNGWREHGSTEELTEPLVTTVPVLDLLAGEAPLLPTRWLHAPSTVDATKLARDAEDAMRALASMRHAPHPPVPEFSVVSLDGPRPRVRVQELIDTGRAKLVRASRTKIDEYRTEGGVPVWLPADIRPVWEREDVRRFLDPDHVDRRSVTQPGDVVLTTVGGLRTRVDVEGGHVLGTSLQALRLSPGTLDPRAAAVLLPSESNQRLQTGSTIPRVNVRELEIPVFSLDESAMLVDLIDALEREQEVAETLARRAADVRSAVVAALATGAVAFHGPGNGSRR